MTIISIIICIFLIFKLKKMEEENKSIEYYLYIFSFFFFLYSIFFPYILNIIIGIPYYWLMYLIKNYLIIILIKILLYLTEFKFVVDVVKTYNDIFIELKELYLYLDNSVLNLLLSLFNSPKSILFCIKDLTGAIIGLSMVIFSFLMYTIVILFALLTYIFFLPMKVSSIPYEEILYLKEVITKTIILFTFIGLTCLSIMFIFIKKLISFKRRELEDINKKFSILYPEIRYIYERTEKQIEFLLLLKKNTRYIIIIIIIIYCCILFLI